MSQANLREAIETFHHWRRELLLPGHAAGPEVPDPELVLSSRMLKVFAKLHPELNQFMVQLQMHFLEEDYTNRVKPDAWREIMQNVEVD